MSMPASTDLFRESTNAVGNRQSNDNHVDEQSLNQVEQLVGAPGVKGRERQNDEAHEQFHRLAIKQTGHSGCSFKKTSLRLAP